MKLEHKIAIVNLYGFISDLVDIGVIDADMTNDDGVVLGELMDKALVAVSAMYDEEKNGS